MKIGGKAYKAYTDYSKDPNMTYITISPEELAEQITMEEITKIFYAKQNTIAPPIFKPLPTNERMEELNDRDFVREGLKVINSQIVDEGVIKLKKSGIEKLNKVIRVLNKER